MFDKIKASDGSEYTPNAVFTDEGGNLVGVIGQDATPDLSAGEMQYTVEAVVREVVIPAYNSLVDALNALSAASNIGAEDPDGDTSNVQEELEKRIITGNVKYIRLNSDKVLETSADGITWEATGSGASVVSTQYQESSSGTIPPTGTWQDSVPTVTGGNYLWTRFEWNNGTYSYVASRYGIDGAGSVSSVDGVNPSENGNVELGAEKTANKSTIISASSTDAQYPTAKAVYDYAGKKVKTESVTLDTTWTASGDNYTKTVTISGVTENSKIDVQPDATTIAQLVNDGVIALYFANDNGAVSAVAVGAQPTASMTVQVTITEVTV